MKKEGFTACLLICCLLSACGSYSSQEKIASSEQTQVSEAQSNATLNSEEGNNIASEEAGDKLQDEDFLNNIKQGLQERWRLLENEDEETLPPEDEADIYINSYVAAEKNSIGSLDNYSFKEEKLKTLAEQYLAALDTSAEKYIPAFVDEDETSENLFYDAYDKRRNIVQTLVDDYGLEFDKEYDPHWKSFLYYMTEVDSTFDSGYEVEDELKTADLYVSGVAYGWTEDLQPYLVAKVTNNTDKYLTYAEIEFLVWDNKDQPVQIDENEYYTVLGYDDINLPAGETKDYQTGMIVSASSDDIKRIGAIVSYGEFDDDTIFENPFYDEWEEIYFEEPYEENTEDDTETDDESDDNSGLYTLIDFYADITVDDLDQPQFELYNRASSCGMKYFADTREGSYHIDFISDISPTRSDGQGSEMYEFSAPHIKLVYAKESGTDDYYLEKVSYRRRTGGAEVIGTYWADTLRYKVKDQYFDSAEDAVAYLRSLE